MKPTLLEEGFTRSFSTRLLIFERRMSWSPLCLSSWFRSKSQIHITFLHYAGLPLDTVFYSSAKQGPRSGTFSSFYFLHPVFPAAIRKISQGPSALASALPSIAGLFTCHLHACITNSFGDFWLKPSRCTVEKYLVSRTFSLLSNVAASLQSSWPNLFTHKTALCSSFDVHLERGDYHPSFFYEELLPIVFSHRTVAYT